MWATTFTGIIALSAFIASLIVSFIIYPIFSWIFFDNLFYYTEESATIAETLVYFSLIIIVTAYIAYLIIKTNFP